MKRLTAVWGSDYDMHMDQNYPRPVCPICRDPFGRDEDGKERCYNCGRVISVTDPDMIEWLKVRRETKTEMWDCWSCGGKACVEAHLHRNPITLLWQGAYGHCTKFDMNWIV
jgi:hypothetical protein